MPRWPLEGFPTVAGCSLSVQHARTELNTKRNTVLRLAAKAVEESEHSKGQQVKIAWGSDRQVKVGEEVVFQQNKAGVSGSFRGKYSELPVP